MINIGGKDLKIFKYETLKLPLRKCTFIKLLKDLGFEKVENKRYVVYRRIHDLNVVFKCMLKKLKKYLKKS